MAALLPHKQVEHKAEAYAPLQQVCWHSLLGALQPLMGLLSDLTNRLCIWLIARLEPLHMCNLYALTNCYLWVFKAEISVSMHHVCQQTCWFCQRFLYDLTSKLCIVLSERSGVQKEKKRKHDEFRHCMKKELGFPGGLYLGFPGALYLGLPGGCT